MKRTFLALLSVLILAIIAAPTGAQDGNLLQDPGFEGEYTGRGASDLNVSAPWQLTVVTSPRTADWMNLQPFAFPHLGPGPNPHSGARAQNFNRGYATFTVAVYQTISVAQGTNLIASAWAQVKTCNIPANADNCQSSGDSGVYTRVGIDPNGGTNVFDSDIVWSANAAPHDTWLQMTANATTTAGSATIFLFSTQNLPAQLNKLYWDDAYLGTGGPGGAAPGTTPLAPPTATPLPYVPFVVPQNERPDGSLIHIVGPGDTLDSIAFAYGMTRDQVLELNPQIRDARYILQGQEITIRPPGIAAGIGSEPTAIPETGSQPETSLAGPVEPTPPPSAPIVAPAGTTTERPIGVVGGSAGLSGYFPPHTYRHVGFNIGAPPSMASASPGSAYAALPATTTDLTVAAGRTPADFNFGEDASAKWLARRQADTTPAPTGGLSEPVQSSNSAPAPVTSDVPPALNPVVESASVCVVLFNDTNRNRIQEFGEALLSGAAILLDDGVNAPITYTTDGTSEPHCFDQLAAGTWMVSAQAPADYGLTTPSQFVVQAVEGVPVSVTFGAAQGVVPVLPAPADEVVVQTEPVQPRSTAALIRENLGLLVIGVAVFVLFTGMVLTLLVRSTRHDEER